MTIQQGAQCVYVPLLFFSKPCILLGKCGSLSSHSLLKLTHCFFGGIQLRPQFGIFYRKIFI
ncbi:MAG: hypothetical protein BGO75_13065 [Burkholderiales bacterium 68-20]|nr:MAG: hypothetical protein BGO75_13065 [Burkholderiales bacterium 68-20]